MSVAAPSTSRVVACCRCPNDTRNLLVKITPGGLCATCAAYDDAHRHTDLAAELDGVRALAARGGSIGCLFGLSGGKDSTAALVRAVELGLRPAAFTFDTGYYPPHIATRAAHAARLVGVTHEVIDLKPYVRASDLESFRLTADLFDEPDTPQLVRRFRHLYVLGRQRFSVRHSAPMAYVRTCQLCRRLVVRAYHTEATRRGAQLVVVGTNEWVGLAASAAGGAGRFSAVRALRPRPDVDPVFVVHLPYLLRTRLADTQVVLARIGWRPPATEDLVESNANSCLLSRAAEAPAARLLGFHPDTSRLAREVTAGFLTRDQAVAALDKAHPFPSTVREVLTRANIL